jgi:PAS domain S-box-containing protein
VVVNSQSLLVSRQARDLLVDSTSHWALIHAESIAREMGGPLASAADEPGPARTLSAKLAEAERRFELVSLCAFDLEGRLLAASPRCQRGVSAPLPPRLRMELVEKGTVRTEVRPSYEPETAVFAVLRAILDEEGAVRGYLQIEFPARELADLNRRLRATLFYQVTAVSFLLLAAVVFLNSLLAPHRRLMAEARTAARQFDTRTEAATAEEGQFLLSTFQEVVSRLKDKERELAEMHQREKLRADETEALATDIISSMTTGLVSVDVSGLVMTVNQAAEAIFSRRAVEAVGKPLREAFPGSESLAAWAEAACERGESALRRRVDYRRPDSESTIHLGASVIPLRAPGGRVRGALCLFANLTEVMELRERLVLRENLARLGELSAGIAHEFRNSLGTIIGNAQLLEKAGVSGEAAVLVEALVEESRSMNHVVAEFLQFARPEKLRCESIDLGRLVAELSRDLEPRAANAGVRLELDAQPCKLEADELLLRKAVSNLVINAIEASEHREGGRVEIRTGRDNGDVLVEVNDNGAGIPREDLARIFTPFFTTKQGGTGLGLALVQKVAVSHGGRVDVRARAQGGTSFLLVIPERQLPERSPDDWV